MSNNLGVLVGTDAVIKTTDNVGVHTPHHNVDNFGVIVTRTDRSGSIVSGGVAQALMASNANRKGWLIQNNGSVDLWYNELGGTAVASQPSIRLSPGERHESPISTPTAAAISIIGSTTGQTFSAREW